MKKIFLIAFAVSAVIAGCGSDHKDTSDSDSLVDTTMNASPGLDTNGVGTDTIFTDTANVDTNKTNNPNGSSN